MKPVIQFHAINAIDLGDITHFPAEPGRPEFWSRHMTIASEGERFTVPLFSSASAKALMFPASAASPQVHEPIAVASRLVDAKAELQSSLYTCPECQEAMIRKKERPGEVFCPNPGCSKAWMKDSEAIPF